MFGRDKADLIENLPIVPMRDLVVFPHMMIPFVVGRKSSIRALDQDVVAERMPSLDRVLALVPEPFERVEVYFAPDLVGGDGLAPEPHPLGLDDYLNDLDVRQLIEDAWDHAGAAERRALEPRLIAADERMRALVHPVAECLWGDRVARREGWSAEANWWYFSLPRRPGPCRPS